ncbi:Cohesin subunit psc3 [Pleurostoma richardsiae]|uniref:Cohesin subunit psc3 n=1 Tax=Pleurostoma richardsiae TaxID=41990 RepID=A0AA38RBA6_9PEZI|nr:Cohesin subunit psc3 [Pleurostoma richardsiae]
MASTENTATPSPAPTAEARRRSGRVSRAPEKFAPEPSAIAKRKRDAEDEDDEDDEDVENQEPEDEDDVSEEDESDSASDEEVARPKRKRPASSQAAKAKKPAAKKPKTNGTAPSSSNNGANLPSRPKPKKTVRVVTGDRRDGDGIYAEIFGSGDSSDDVASHWYQSYTTEKEAAVTDLVNCILLASGCDQQVTEDDIRDPDNIQNRLSELQDLYQEQQITDYPLAKAKEGKAFRDLLVGFFKSLVNIMHETEVLYSDGPLMENIARWVGTMSSSTLRPFRHTATTIALAIELALVDVARKLDDRITKMTQQVEAEKHRKGKNKNKDVLSRLQQSLDEANQNREVCGDQIRDFFEVVFVHRYRDVDPRIRTECVDALGAWIWHLPTVFLEPEYLRYLGWMLSDIVPSTRLEVLKQLARIFKRDAEKLGHFIDRFRPRLMEMATRDADVSVRVAALNVIETLRGKGMLDPEEIDTTGKLIFDSEPRVRKAVVQFFADCVADVVELKVEEVGGADALDELFPDDDDADPSVPGKSWLHIKALAETLATYDAQLDEEGLASNIPRGLDIAADVANVAAMETRISLAAQALYEKMDVVRDWETLSHYLIFDHTASTKSKSKASANSPERIFRKAVAPEAQEESILLEVLAAAVKVSLAQGSEAEKHKKKPTKVEAVESTEEVALHLATIIPKLLKKFGAEPRTATIVLRLEHFLDLDVFVQLRQDSTTYAQLLDEICTQFNRHVDKDVLTETTTALLHARNHEELEEIAESKLSSLWEEVLNSLRNFDKTNELSIRGNLDEAVLTQFSNTLAKISKLASVSNCVDVLEAEGSSDESKAPAIDILTQTVHRGLYERVDEELDDLEDEVTSYAIQSCHFYFMWKVRSLMSAIEMQTAILSAEVDRVSMLRKTYQTNLIHTLSSRATNDDLRLLATGSLCDLHVLFGTLGRVLDQWRGAGAMQKYAGLQVLVHEIPTGLVPELISIFDGAERAYARKTKKTLNEPAEDEDPIDDEFLSDDEDEDDVSPEQKRAAELRAEKTLCELAAKYVVAIHAGVLDLSGPQAGKLKRRLLRNQHKLGPSYRDTVAYLDDSKLRELTSGKKKSAAKKSSSSKGKQPAGAGAKTAARSEEIVVADDESEDEDPFADDEPEEGTAEDLRRRELLEEDEPESEEGEDGNDQANDGMDEDDDILGD